MDFLKVNAQIDTNFSCKKRNNYALYNPIVHASRKYCQTRNEYPHKISPRQKGANFLRSKDEDADLLRIYGEPAQLCNTEPSEAKN